MKKQFWAVILIITVFVLASCSDKQESALDEQELTAAQELLATDGEFTDMTADVMTADRQEKFPAVDKVATSEDGDWIFICSPVGYNGPIKIAVAIDSESGCSVGIRILEHLETEEYVRDMESDWFTDRFADKDVTKDLYTSHLTAENEQEVIIITGSTVTTQGVINGVNAAFAVYREYVLGEDQEAIPLEVEEENGPGLDQQ